MVAVVKNSSKGADNGASKIISRADLQGFPARQSNANVSLLGTALDAGATGVVTAQGMQQLQEQAYKEAYAKGLEKGRQEARQIGLKEMKAQVDRLSAILTELENPLENFDKEIADTLVDMVLSIANHLIRRELKTEPGQIIAVVKEAVAALPINAQRILLHLHPEDAQLVRETMAVRDETDSWRVVEDPTLSRGGCKIVTENSQIDATVEARLAAIAAKVFGDERDPGDEV